MHAGWRAVPIIGSALCHGADGLGQRAGDHQVLPPRWGSRSFNWGAGMHQPGNASAFIKANMPLGNSDDSLYGWTVNGHLLGGGH